MNFNFKATDGGMGFADMTKARFKEHLKEHEGMTYDIIPRKTKRTVTQNNYVHVLFDYISAETGESREEIKTIEKRRHLQPKEIEIFGEKQLVLPSLSNIEKQEMSEFIERVLADCAFLGIIVPTASELGYLPR